MGYREGWQGVDVCWHLVLFPHGPPVWYWSPSAPPNFSSISGKNMDGAQLANIRRHLEIGWMDKNVRWQPGELSGGELDESRIIANEAIARWRSMKDWRPR